MLQWIYQKFYHQAVKDKDEEEGERGLEKDTQTMYKSRISTRFNAFLWSQIDTLKYTEKMY